jgi:oxygen-independent coproporphyrinogen-3 oxidase
MTPATWQIAGFGIYVHWPFCAAKCPYCDFNSHVSARIDQGAFREAYLGELAFWAERTPGRIVSSVFFGGGTPSLMEPETVAAILDYIRRSWPVANDLEVTLEANPTSVEAGRFRGFADAGVTRFSIGMQALRDEDLRRLGRLHSAAEARKAYDVARSISDRVSFDLIYARQHQDLTAWKQELSEAIAMGPDHLALYQLTIEEGTAFWDRARAGRLRGLPVEDLSADLFDATQEICGAAGLPRYEVSNHSRPGAECRHNLVYWRGGEWLGIGPGAHGRVEVDGVRLATVALRAPEAWRRRVQEAGHGLEIRSALTPLEIADEYVLMALRLSEGMHWDRLERLEESVDLEAYRELLQDGFLKDTQGGIAATEAGVLLLDAIISRLRAGT